MPKKSKASAEGALSIQVPVEFLCLTEVIAELEKDMLAVEAGTKNYAEVEQKIAEVHEKIAQVAVQTLKNRLNREP